jgi:hypothetical protein
VRKCRCAYLCVCVCVCMREINRHRGVEKKKKARVGGTSWESHGVLFACMPAAVYHE